MTPAPPRSITFTADMTPKAMAEALNEWTRDTHRALVELLSRDPMQRVIPTPVLISGYHAKPWDAVLVDGAKAPLTVHLPDARAENVRTSIILVINVTSSTNTITVRPGYPGQRVNGEATHTIAIPFGCRLFYSNGEHWFTLSDIGGDEERVATPSNALLWEWNGTDTTQFEDTEAFGPGDTTLSVVARSDVPGGQCLRYERGILGAATPPGIWLVLASELTLPPRFEAEILVRECGTSSSGRGGGIAFYCDPDHSSGFHGYTWTFSGNGADSVSRVDAGTVSTASPYGAANALDTNAGGVARIAFEMVQGSGEVPRWVAHGEGRHPYTAGAERMSTDAILGNTDLQYEQSISAAPSSWQTANPTRFGLAFTFVSNSLAIDYYEVAALRVYKHPRDL